MKKKLTQEKVFFYVLWKNYHTTPEQYIPVWKFIGEVYLEELGVWFFMSYKCLSNGANTYLKNPGLIERRQARGTKTGAKYYEYRIAPNPSRSKITEPSLMMFYDDLIEAKRKLTLIPKS